MKYKPQDYLEVCPFIGDEGSRTLQTSRIVKTRKDHMYLLTGRTIEAGSYARHDKSLVDGCFWGNYYISIDELDRIIEETTFTPYPDIKPYKEFEAYNGE
jgi:hypothetical protein